MTDTPDVDTTASPTTDPDGRSATDPHERSATDPDQEEGGRRRRLKDLLDKAALGAFVFVALVTAIGFYRYTGATVRTWVDPAYQPIVLAAFNLALLFVAIAGASVQLRRLGED